MKVCVTKIHVMNFHKQEMTINKH